MKSEERRITLAGGKCWSIFGGVDVGMCSNEGIGLKDTGVVLQV